MKWVPMSPLVVAPTVHGDWVYLSNGRSVVALDRLSHRERWLAKQQAFFGSDWIGASTLILGSKGHDVQHRVVATERETEASLARR